MDRSLGLWMIPSTANKSKVTIKTAPSQRPTEKFLSCGEANKLFMTTINTVLCHFHDWEDTFTSGSICFKKVEGI